MIMFSFRSITFFLLLYFGEWNTAENVYKYNISRTVSIAYLSIFVLGTVQGWWFIGLDLLNLSRVSQINSWLLTNFLMKLLKLVKFKCLGFYALSYHFIYLHKMFI